MVPLVTVICTCCNQEVFIQSALDSVLEQKGVEVELFVIDNGSMDNSRKKIEQWVAENPGLAANLIFRDEAINYCRSFNEALKLSRGEYLVDLSGDDKLLERHLEKSVQKLQANPSAAICFSDAMIVEGGKKHGFYEKNRFGPPVIDCGDVYEKVIYQYCISTVTMVFRTSFLKEVSGYDESLVYEDFDIVCRLARKHPFCFSEHVGVEKTQHATNFSLQQYKSKDSKFLWSTLWVCQKIRKMNRTETENRNLSKRTLHEAKHALLSGNREVAREFLGLAEELGYLGVRGRVMKMIC
ncbi:glycosyltransferase family 2 protein [Litoribacter populi]|uniref:glycosyltransferase family 2 protein n=1 Tax=Litoribacter populi TaxID=2598460 RepID=UPI00117CC505|nr:glycosyltransferase [Litoribacter populi]